MTKQGWDVIFVSVLSGVTMLACMTGFGWGLYGLLRLAKIGKDDT